MGTHTQLEDVFAICCNICIAYTVASCTQVWCVPSVHSNPSPHTQTVWAAEPFFLMFYLLTHHGGISSVQTWFVSAKSKVKTVKMCQCANVNVPNCKESFKISVYLCCSFLTKCLADQVLRHIECFAFVWGLRGFSRITLYFKGLFMFPVQNSHLEKCYSKIKSSRLRLDIHVLCIIKKNSTSCSNQRLFANIVAYVNKW